MLERVLKGCQHCVQEKKLNMAGRVMDWISRIKNWRFSRNGHQNTESESVSQENNLSKALGHFEPYVMKAQSILIWENPMISVLCIIIFNILYGLAINFEIRFYGLIFTLLLCFFICDLCFEKIWPNMSISSQQPSMQQQQVAHSRILTVSEISRYVSQIQEILKDYYVWLKNLRDDQPGTFCCAMCLLFALLTFIGRTVPGAVLGYCILMSVMIGPGIYIHVLPPSLKQRVNTFQAALRSKEKGEMDSEVEEYLPEQSGETLALLQQATEPVEEDQREESLIVEEFGLDLESADASILGNEDGSTDGLDISEFDLSAPPSLGGSTTNSYTNNNHQQLTQSSVSRMTVRRRHDLTVDDSDDSDEDVGDGIHFQSHHFNQDSSEEEEQAFVQGLVFSEPVSGGVTAVGATGLSQTAASTSLGEMLTTTAVNVVSKNISNLAALHSSLISSMINAATEKASSSQPLLEQGLKGQKGTREVSRDDSSSSGESEFEMISHNDLT